MRKRRIAKSWLIMLAASAAVLSCKEDTPATPEEKVEGQFLVAAVASAGGTTATYFLPAESLDDPNASISPIGNGYEFSNTFSNFIPNGYDGFVALKYGQGNAHIGQRFTINAQGKADVIGAQFELQNGFITAGTVGDVVYTLMSGFRSSDPTLATANRIPMSSGVPDYAFLPTNKFAGYDGKNAAMIGIADAGNGSFYSGLNFWENTDIDDVVVAKVNANTLTVDAVYSDPRLTVSGGFYRSARYSQIGTAENGDVYVFSGSNPGTKKAGALVIRKGASGFDQNYYWDIETASGGYRFRKVWHAKDDIFLLEFYNEKVESGTSSSALGVATQFAVLDMSEKKFTWVSGLPDKSEIPDLGVTWPYVFQGKVYMGVTTTTEDPRFYVLDPVTGVAQKGLLVKNADSLPSVTFVEKK